MDDAIRLKVQNSFQQQKIMNTIGASLTLVDTGRVEISLPFNEALTQQHGFLHAGIVATALDSACGYAALSTMPPEAGILSIEFKVNLLAPAKGRLFTAVGEVVKPGRTITVTNGELFAMESADSGPGKRVATMTATMMAILDRKDVTN